MLGWGHIPPPPQMCRAHQYKWHLRTCRRHLITGKLDPKHDRKRVLPVGSIWNQSNPLSVFVYWRKRPRCVIYLSNNSFANENEVRVQQEGGYSVRTCLINFLSDGSVLKKVLVVSWEKKRLLVMSGECAERRWRRRLFRQGSWGDENPAGRGNRTPIRG